MLVKKIKGCWRHAILPNLGELQIAKMEERLPSNVNPDFIALSAPVEADLNVSNRLKRKERLIYLNDSCIRFIISLRYGIINQIK